MKATPARPALRRFQAFLKSVPLFSTLTDADLNILEGLFTTVACSENRVLCREGDAADHFYVVKRGFFRLLKACSQEGEPPCRDGKTCSKSRKGLSKAARGMPLKHFDLGEIGPKNILGENGILHQPEKTPLATWPGLLSAASSPPSSPSTTTDTTPDDTSAGTPAEMPSSTLPPLVTTPGTSSQTPANDGVASSTTTRTVDVSSAVAAARSFTFNLIRKRGVLAVSAVASRGGAQAYVANTFELKRLQTPSFRFCWDNAGRFNRSRMSVLDVPALSEQLRKQVEWEAYKQKVVRETVRLDRLEHIMVAGGRGLRSQGQ